jgi:hypothetical protein
LEVLSDKLIEAESLRLGQLLIQNVGVGSFELVTSAGDLRQAQHKLVGLIRQIARLIWLELAQGEMALRTERQVQALLTRDLVQNNGDTDNISWLDWQNDSVLNIERNIARNKHGGALSRHNFIADMNIARDTGVRQRTLHFLDALVRQQKDRVVDT